MVLESIKKLVETNAGNTVELSGICHDCGKAIRVKLSFGEHEEIKAEGGAVYNPEEKEIREGNVFLKCTDCFENAPKLRNWKDIEVYSRVVGYLRPVKQWNKGKISEFGTRKVFSIK